jgi:ABC-type uncharacterized transport system substrate-binding protein
MKNFLIPLILIFALESGPAYDLLIIDSQASDPYVPVREAMLEELEKRGFIEGRNLNVTIWSLANREGLARRAWLMEKDHDYDLVFLNGTVAAASFRDFALGDFKYKFLFGAVTDPVGLGVIKDFTSPPPSNFTGIAYPVPVRERLRFIRDVLPDVKEIGYIYADMPQSHSYLKWLQEILQEDEFSSLNFHFRVVEFVQSESGHVRMAMLSEEFIEELDPLVDAFLSSNDQMGVQPDYARALRRLSDKPLIGLGEKDVMDEWGAVISLFPDLEQMGVQLAGMAEQLMTGAEVEEFVPRWAPTGVAVNLREAERLGITIPESYIERAGDTIIR